MSSSQLRRALRMHRRIMPASQRETAAQSLLQQFLLSPFTQLQHVAIYWAVDGEIDPSYVIRWLWQQQKHCYLPVVNKRPSKVLNFASYTAQTPMKPNRFYIPEPAAADQQCIAAADIELILLPTVGFDNVGHRLGMGGGFYDLTLKDRNLNTKPLLVGLAYEGQRVDKLVPKETDVHIDAVITEKHYYLFRNDLDALLAI